MKSINKYKVIGLMSGTSMDGLDLVDCEFSYNGGQWQFRIHHSATIKYSSSWKNKLSGAHRLGGEELLALDADYGRLLGEKCKNFIQSEKIKQVDFISSHGHTIFHQPSRRFTFQLGNGSALSATAGLPVVFDFRSLDVAWGGQGAPLVPMGDKLLFNSFQYCLNLGGIANISFGKGKKRTAFDICYLNMGLNYLAQLADKEYDINGRMAEAGQVNNKLLMKIISHYNKLNNKPSLSREGFENFIRPQLTEIEISLADMMSTFCESAAVMIAQSLPRQSSGKLLITGGGSYNSFLIKRIQYHLPGSVEIVIPEKTVVKFKEALIFALLGVLRVRNEINCLKEVTGAVCNCSSGLLVGF